MEIPGSTTSQILKQERTARGRESNSNTQILETTPATGQSLPSLRIPTPPPRLLNFFWEVIDSINFPHIVLPFIYRDNEKYLSVRMIEKAILNEFVSINSDEVSRYGTLQSVNLSEAEANTFNEINSEHLQMKYGQERYDIDDSMVKLETFLEFYDILRRTCKNKHGRFLKQVYKESNKTNFSNNIVQTVLNPSLQKRPIPAFIQNQNNSQIIGVSQIPPNINVQYNQIRQSVMLQNNNQIQSIYPHMHQQLQNNYILGEVNDIYRHKKTAQSYPSNEVNYMQGNNLFLPQNQHNIIMYNTHQQKMGNNQILRNIQSPNLVNSEQNLIASNQSMRLNTPPNLQDQQQNNPIPRSDRYGTTVQSANYVVSGNSPGFQLVKNNVSLQVNSSTIAKNNQISSHMQNYEQNSLIEQSNQSHFQNEPHQVIKALTTNSPVSFCQSSPNPPDMNPNLLKCSTPSDNSSMISSKTTLGVSELSQDFLQQLKSKINDPTCQTLSQVNDLKSHNTDKTMIEKNQIESIVSNTIMQTEKLIENKNLASGMKEQDKSSESSDSSSHEINSPSDETKVLTDTTQNIPQASLISIDEDDDIIILDFETPKKLKSIPSKILSDIKTEKKQNDKKMKDIESRSEPIDTMILTYPITLNTEMISDATRTIFKKSKKKQAELLLSNLPTESTSEICENQNPRIYRKFIQVNQYKIPYVTGSGEYRISLRSRKCDKYLACSTLAKIGFLPADMNEERLKKTFKSFCYASQAQLVGLKSNESEYTQEKLFDNRNTGIICISEIFLNYLNKPYYIRCIPHSKEIVNYNININEALFKMTGGIILINSPMHRIISPFKECGTKILVPESVVKNALLDIESNKQFKVEPKLSKGESLLLKNFFQILMFYFLYSNEKINDVHLINIENWIKDFPKNFEIANRFTENFPRDWNQPENIEESVPKETVPKELSIKCSPKTFDDKRSINSCSLSPNSLYSDSSIRSFKMSKNSKICVIQSVCSVSSRSNSIRDSVSSEESDIKSIVSIKTEEENPIVNNKIYINKKDIYASIKKFDRIIKSKKNNDEKPQRIAKNSTEFFGTLRRVFSSSNFFTQKEYTICYSRFEKIKRSKSFLQINLKKNSTQMLIESNSRIMEDIKTNLLDNVQVIPRIFREYLFNNSYYVQILISIGRRQLNKNLKKMNVRDKLRNFRKQKENNETIIDTKPDITYNDTKKGEHEKNKPGLSSRKPSQQKNPNLNKRIFSNNYKKRREHESTSDSVEDSIDSTDFDQNEKNLSKQKEIKRHNLPNNILKDSKNDDLYTTDGFDEEYFLEKYQIKPCKVRLETLGPHDLKIKGQKINKRNSDKSIMSHSVSKRLKKMDIMNPKIIFTNKRKKQNEKSHSSCSSIEIAACSSKTELKKKDSRIYIENDKMQVLGRLSQNTYHSRSIADSKKSEICNKINKNNKQTNVSDDELPDSDI